MIRPNVDPEMAIASMSFIKTYGESNQNVMRGA